MIRPRYALKLARTKLRSKRGMLITSIIVASILFAVLISLIVVFTGAEKSAANFLRKANNDRYLVEVKPVIPRDVASFPVDLSLDDIAQIKAFEKSYYERLRAKYKEAGIKYDESQEVPALIAIPWKSKALPEEQRVGLNFESPVVGEMVNTKQNEYARTAKNKFSDLQTIADKYGASAYYMSRPSRLMGIPNVRLIQDGKENFSDRDLKVGDLSIYGYFTNAVRNGMYTFEDAQLLQRYLLIGDDEPIKGIPVIISAQEAVSLFGKDLGLKAEPEGDREKAGWLKDVQAKMRGYVYQACYRNDAEITMLDKLQQDYAMMEANKNDKDYLKPSLIYDLPNEGCSDILIKEDTRTVQEKRADVSLVEAQKKLGIYEAPSHTLLTFQVVGVANAQASSKHTDNINSYLKNLVTIENRTDSALIPRQLYDKLPDEQKLESLPLANKSETNALASVDFATRVVEFRTIDEARRFMNQETCPGMAANCQKLFTADPYGSNYLILDEMGKTFQKLIMFVLPIILGLATIIIWFTMARVMADNRKETAVYRAMGAGRIDIAAIYLTYSMIVALRIVILSTLLGLIVACVIHYLYADRLTAVTIASFGTITEELKFNLFDLSSPLLPLVAVAILVTSLVAVLYPMIRNVSRSPIKDMRSD